MARTGRRPGATGTRTQILEAARAEFAERGYDGATIRALAGQAGVDPALVHHYFGSKDRLFIAAMELPVDLGTMIDRVIPGGRDGLGMRAAHMLLSVWDDEAARGHLVGLIRAAVSNEKAANMVREFIQTEVLGRLVRAIDAPQPALRAALAGSQVIGLVMARYIIGVEPLASADRETVARAIAPNLQRYLTGPLE
jgi:AcrR family transcriptional regulator